MQLGLALFGVVAVGIGAASLYLTRHHVDRLPLDDGQLDGIRVGVAIGAGVLITVGLFMFAAGLLT